MFDEEASEDMNADEATAMGGKRFASMSLFDAPVFIPPDPGWASVTRDLARKQLSDGAGIEDLMCAYVELLTRAKALVDFWDNNVGPTADWPVSVVGESDEVEACLLRRVDKLRSVVSFVEESACG